MSLLRKWFRSSSPTVKMLMAISITSIFAVGYKMYLSPYLNRQRHRRAEDWANMIIEQEESMQESQNQ